MRETTTLWVHRFTGRPKLISNGRRPKPWLQEQVYGGLSRATRRRLRTLAKAFSETGRIAPENGTKVRPGARLVRE